MAAVLATLAASTLRTLAAMLVVIAVVVVVAVSQFRLTVFGAVALYFVVWWTLLFVILPIRNQAETDPALVVPGQDPGAPASPRLREKALWTTLLASVVFLAAIPLFELAGL
jgi:predicted secreted protein